MRRLALAAAAAVALGLGACGGSGTPSVKITLGLTGGTMVPYTITIAPGGAVSTTGQPPTKGPPSDSWRLTSAEDAKLSRLVRNSFGNLKSEQCSGTFPDESAVFITALGKTVTVRGNCEPGFTKLWSAVTTALGLYTT
jgi:hypothetical protein